MFFHFNLRIHLAFLKSHLTFKTSSRLSLTFVYLGRSSFLHSWRLILLDVEFLIYKGFFQLFNYVNSLPSGVCGLMKNKLLIFLRISYTWWVASLLLLVLFLAFDALTVMCLSMDHFQFHPGVCWASKMCRFISFIKFGTFIGHYLLKYSFCPFLLLLDSHNAYLIAFDSAPPVL